MIRLDNWWVSLDLGDRMIGYESDHLHRRLEIAVDLDAGWAVKLDMALGKAKNVVDLERTGDVLWVDLTRDILASDGLYRCQLRGLKGDTVAHSNQFELLVSGSINAAEAFPSVEPSELAQMEARVTQAKADAVAAADRAEAAAEVLPSVKVTRTETGALLTAVDASGETTTAEVMDGVQGPAGIGVPEGGESGQLLTRTADGTAWQDAPESAVQPDWTQNDPDAKDYIKGRTHYSVRGEKQYPAWTDTRDPIPLDATHRYKVLVFGNGYSKQPVVWGEHLTEGTAEIFTPQTDESDGSLYIGDLEQGNPPFCIKAGETSVNSQWVSMLKVYDIVLLDLDGETVHPLDAKYLPDLHSDWAQNDPTALGYVKNRTHYETWDAIFDGDLTWPGGYVSNSVPYTTAPVVGETYKVVFNGTVYSAVIAEQYSDTSIQLHVGGWYLRWNTTSQELYGFNQGGAKNTYHVAVYQNAVHPLDPKFLPEYVITITHTVDSEGNEAFACDREPTDILAAYRSGMLMKVVIEQVTPDNNLKVITRNIEYAQGGGMEGLMVYSDIASLTLMITPDGISRF